jgi:hypothetical protein
MDLVWLKRSVLVVGAVATLAIFLRSAGTLAALLDFPTLVFLGWCLLPIGHLWIFGRDDDPLPTRMVLAAAAAMIVVFGLWVYVDRMLIHLDPKSASAFLVVPAMQLAVAIPAVLAGWILRRRAQAVDATGSRQNMSQG